MQCEICGKSFSFGKKIDVDGSQLMACNDCASFGKELVEISAQKRFESKPVPSVSRPFIQKSSAEEFGEMSVVRDYGSRIRHAREKMNLTIEDFAKKLSEHDSILKKIESQKILPTDSMIGKLEKACGISLREKPES